MSYRLVTLVFTRQAAIIVIALPESRESSHDPGQVTVRRFLMHFECNLQWQPEKEMKP